VSEATQQLNHAKKLAGLPSGHPELGKIVLQELDRILVSPYFKNSLRGRQFLKYIVHCRLAGRTEELKERTIGMELFQRQPNYATGEDPVVRVQAGEVRRRLEQYYQAETKHTPVRIELPVGSYAPYFRLRTAEPVEKPEKRPETPAGLSGKPAKTRRGVLVLSLAGLCAAITAAVWITSVKARHNAEQPSKVEQFWAPALASQQPMLICLAKPVVYRPTYELYRRYSSVHPGTFQTEMERSNQLLPLAPDTKLVWSEMMPFPDYGVALGDVEAAVGVSALLGKLGKPTQLRIGDHYSFEDLHDSPSVLIGAFNNKWTMQITTGLRFEFVEEDGDFTIRERVSNGRIWHAKYDQSQRSGHDFAIAARLLDSDTGQFTVTAAGLAGSGTQAAGDFISHPDALEKALRMLPVGWQKKNLEFVLETDVTDWVAGPARVVAVHAW
jgi:hypothetical protein